MKGHKIMSERLSLNNSWQARERMVELCEAGKPWQNHSGSFHGRAVTTEHVETGQMPRAQAELLREFGRKGELEYVIFSYRTPIAYRAHGEWYIPTTKYSPTTSKHQGHLWRLGRHAAQV